MYLRGCNRSACHRSLFLEILLASNGGTLSHRFLGKVGQLSIHHNFYIIVDEILTSPNAIIISLRKALQSTATFFARSLLVSHWIGGALAIHKRRSASSQSTSDVLRRHGRIVRLHGHRKYGGWIVFLWHFGALQIKFDFVPTLVYTNIVWTHLET